MSRSQRPNHQPVVVITGASAGVGRATARRFARSGARVGLIARNEESLTDLADDLAASGAQAVVAPADVAVWEEVDAAAARIEEELGPIDIWVNNAMTSVFAFVHETAPDDFRRVTEVTYLGFVHGTLAALHRMRPRDHGTIIQVSSALAYRGIPLQASYCGAKHAIKGFTETLRAELLHERSDVNVTMVALPGLNTTQFGWVRTTLPRHPQPVPPIYQPEVAAEAIHWSSRHPRRREVLVGFPTVATVWGNKLAAGLLDRYLAKTNVDAQMTDQPLAADRQDDLYDPVTGVHGAHGIFGDQAHGSSPQLWATTHRKALAAVAAAAAAGALTTWRRR